MNVYYTDGFSVSIASGSKLNRCKEDISARFRGSSLRPEKQSDSDDGSYRLRYLIIMGHN